MENRIKEIKSRANKLIGDKKITTLINEAEIIKNVEEIAEEVNDSNYEIYNKTLDEIENYLKAKEQAQTIKKDLEFLTNLAQELRGQQVRITDASSPPLFVISNELGENIYFLTRKSLENYSKCYLKNNKKFVEIPSNRSIELAELLNVIKRNF